MVDLNQPNTLQRAIAIIEIERVLHRYCILAREDAPFSQMANLLHPDGIFCLPNGSEVRPDEMETVIRSNPPAFIRHHLTSVDIEFSDDSAAQTKSLFFALTGTPVVDHWGYWRDVFRRGLDGRWLIAKREIVVEGYDDDGWYAETYGKET